MAGPPLKKRRYVPGGPGGGGRYVDLDGTEVPVGGTGPGGYNYVGPRGRVGRENMANGVQPVPYQRPRRESRRDRAPARPRFSSAAAAAAAVVQGDGFKPREERGWEEFHQDLDIEAKFPVFDADEVDGLTQHTSTPSVSQHVNGSPMLVNGHGSVIDEAESQEHRESQGNGTLGNEAQETTEGIDVGLSTPRRRAGRPPRRTDSMLKGIGSPDIPNVPKFVPLPGPNPREKLTLPKPSFRLVDPFVAFEQKGVGQLNYVDRTMANVGYQESDIYIRPEKVLIRVTDGTIEEDLDVAPATRGDGEANAAIGGVGVGRVEYDMDEQDTKWLEAHNLQRKAEQVEPIKPAVFEVTMTKIEKEWHALEKRIPKPNPKPPQTHRPRSSSAAAVNGEPAVAGEEQDSKCAICDDGDCENTNAIVFCDGCDLAVHQECYGVPFIPEGQWLCRKCQLIGRGTPTCIFCPNTDGAFKQTNASRWSHLLCAIWIPEVSLGNNTFMEPVMDVEKVPKQRWKLNCYICRQKMGACIQCGNKNCFVAFHVTCARRAKLFLKMKSTHGGPASMDASVLKAYCDKHVPADWRRENDVEAATADAIDFYHYTMRGRLWADSQQAALNMTTAHSQDPPILEAVEDSENGQSSLANANKRRRNQPPKIVWKLPSGAPVIPQALYNSVESSLQRFTIRKRKEYAAEACKYWTLKREARRGAALLKRLQLQMETFSSMEITRRNFVGMGPAGRVRLQRRIDFAEQLLQDVDKLRTMCDNARKREEEKLKDAYILKDITNTVYFPIAPLLWPILEKAQILDIKRVFSAGFAQLQERLAVRYYTSVSAFSADFGAVFSTVLGMPMVSDTAQVQAQMNEGTSSKDLTSEYKEKRKLAKRIVKAVQPALEDATRKESELLRKPFEKELQQLDMLLENSLASRRDSMSGPLHEEITETEAAAQQLLSDDQMHSARFNGDSEVSRHEATPANALGISSETPIPMDVDATIPTSRSKEDQKSEIAHHQPTPEHSNETPTMSAVTPQEHLANGLATNSRAGQDTGSIQVHEPPTPPISTGGDPQPLSNGGIPWYMETFDPDGTTIQEERWTGRELVRGMSEELSDMGDEELSGLVDLEPTDGIRESGDDTLHPADADQIAAARRKAAAKRKRWRGYR